MQDGDAHFQVPSIEQLVAEQETGRGEPARQPPEEGAENSASDVAEVLARHQDALFARAGVTMTGEGIDVSGRPAIVIGVRSSADLAGLPTEIEGIPVVAQVIGEISVQDRP
ncbi:MAG: hypothetical protein EA405_12495 [Rhodospirillales bacterium]|nr:MAG: hypothetical protein EA405_12495 [Rhodospirillales bacterium]